MYTLYLRNFPIIADPHGVSITDNGYILAKFFSGCFDRI